MSGAFSKCCSEMGLTSISWKLNRSKAFGELATDCNTSSRMNRMKTHAQRITPIRQHQVFRLSLLALLAIVGWVISAPIVIQSKLEIHAEGLKPGSVLSWSNPEEPVRSGAYALLTSDSVNSMTFEVAPPQEADGKPFEFWLYYVRAESPASFDLNRLVDGGRNPGWSSFPEGDGIVYRGTRSSSLVLPDVYGDVVIGYGRTASSGSVHVIRGGMRTDLQSRSVVQDSKILAIPVSVIDVSSGCYSWNLPSRRAAGFQLELKSKAGAPFAISRVECIRTFGPWEALRTEVNLQAERSIAVIGERRWQSQDGSSVFDVEIPVGFTWVLHALGVSAVLLIMELGRRVVAGARKWWSLLTASKYGAEAAIGALLLCVHGTIAATIPISVSGDGIDYLNAADGLAHGMDWSRVPDYKVPGLSLILAALMRLSADVLTAFGWLSALLAVSNSILVYLFVRTRASRPWALSAAIAVGLHPSLITYQTWLLRELPSAVVMSAIGFALVMFAKGPISRFRSVVGFGIGFGGLCATGAYLRENFVLLLLLVPMGIMFAVRNPVRIRLTVVLIATITAMSALYPRLATIQSKYGSWSMVSPKLSWNRLLSTWQNRDTKGNDIRVYGFDEWNDLLNRSARSEVSDYDFALDAVRSFGSRTGTASSRAEDIEGISARVVQDVRDTNKSRAVWSSTLSFVNQLGLWNVQAGFRRIQAASCEYYSAGLRGMKTTSPDNFAADARAAIRNLQNASHRTRIESVIVESSRSIRFMRDSSFGAFFHEWFYGFRAVRPVIAVLFFIGVVLAIRDRDWTMFAIQTIVILFALATAVGTSALADRFAAPFIPLMWCGALIGLYRITHPRGTTFDPGV